MAVNFEPTPRQHQAFTYLRDAFTTEVLYGGGAGGGKSRLLVSWLILSCIEYNGSRWLLGRSKLKTLKLTTLKSFFEVCNNWGLKAATHFNYNQQQEIITFWNGSEIILKDLFYYPSDPEFTSLGSLEITGAGIDECTEVTEKAIMIVNSRIRFKLNEFKVVPKILMTCNPSKNWVYKKYYKPYRENKLLEYQKFIPALITDNPYIPREYIEQLKKLDRISRERLLLGNWEYDDETGRLFKYDSILNSFTNSFVPEGERFLTCDVARFGSDKIVYIVWSGFRAEKIIYRSKQGIDETVQDIKDLCIDFNIPRSNIVIDDDGVGGGVVDYLRGCKRFINNSSAFNNENYQNLKTQCYFKFADLLNDNKVFINTDEPQLTKMITEELEVIKQFNGDVDGKLRIIPKDQIKLSLGRSPDFADALMMRILPTFKPSTNYQAIKVFNQREDYNDLFKL